MNMSPTQSATKTLARFVRISLAALACAGGGLGLTAACLERPVVKASPNTTNLFVAQIKQTTIDKIDLLFNIDNSVSMSDKQKMLTDAVPSLLQRLLNPNCVNKLDPTITMPGLAACPTGFEKEFSPVRDIHIGVVSSSLGGHGAATVCDAAPPNDPDKNDAGYLIGTTARGGIVPTYNNNLGFLAWDPDAKQTPAGEANQGTLIMNFQNLVGKTGEKGCGFEAQLESWYRFLVEPEPYLTASYDAATQTTVRTGVDTKILEQRKAFLRADSLLAIIMLTDENDCSVVDEGLGWLVGTSQVGGNSFNMPRPTSICATAPNSPCCRSCASKEATAPAGCDPVLADMQCQKGAAMSLALEAAKDPLNLRCFNQKKRFGLDLLYPTERYVLGLREAMLTIPDRTDPNGLKTKTVPNPIYSDLQGNAPFVRGPELVFVAGIVGVPWQDIAEDASVVQTTPGVFAPGLKYLTADEITKRNIWDDILGSPVSGLDPKDPLMIESVTPRSGTNPRTGLALAPATSTNPKANLINGHEYNNAEADDLQYACIFDLPETSKDCLAASSCDCGATPTAGNPLATIQAKVTANNSPLCNPPAGGAPSTTQYAAKGYPGLRILQVLKDYGSNSIVASICPKVSKAANDAEKANPSYGYNPAVTAIIDRLKVALGGRCLPRKLTPSKGNDAEGNPLPPSVPCKVIEARIPKMGETCGCGPGRAPGVVGVEPGTEKLASTVRAELQKKSCTDAKSCDAFCLCEVTQLAGVKGCERDDPPPPALAGYCYIDKAQNIGDPALVSTCPASEQRKLRFVGENTPAAGATTFIACAGASADESDVMPMAPAAQ